MEPWKGPQRMMNTKSQQIGWQAKIPFDSAVSQEYQMRAKSISRSSFELQFSPVLLLGTKSVFQWNCCLGPEAQKVPKKGVRLSTIFSNVLLLMIYMYLQYLC